MMLAAEHLGSKSFRERYGLKYAYLAGAMYRGTSSKELVVAMGRAGLMGFLGTGGMPLEQIRADLKFIQRELASGEAYGMNLLCNLDRPQIEMDTVELYLESGVRCIEAAAFLAMTPAIVYFRASGLKRCIDGRVRCENKIIAKISRPEVAKAFMSPPPERILDELVAQGRITAEQADMAREVAVSFDICVEADSGGHTDQGIPTVLLPSIQILKEEIQNKYAYSSQFHIGLCGGIGSPGAAASAFIMNADFILTGSINQCTVEAGTSDIVKSMLQEMNIQDTDYAPAGDMFELGAKVQVLKRGVFFPARANKLFMLYNHYNSLEEIPTAISTQIEEKYFKKSFAEIWMETLAYLQRMGDIQAIEKASSNPKIKMARVFRWYFSHSSRLAFEGDEKQRVDFQIHTGPALGVFNQWVKGTDLENWRRRHVDVIAEKIMQETAHLINSRFQELRQIAMGTQYETGDMCEPI